MGQATIIVRLSENAEAHTQRKRPQSVARQDQPLYNSNSNAIQTKAPGPEPMQLDAARLHSTERIRRLQNNLCLYCGKSEHFKPQCTEAAITRGRGHGNYRETIDSRGGYQWPNRGVMEPGRGGMQFNRALNWDQASATPPPESTVGDLTPPESTVYLGRKTIAVFAQELPSGAAL
jgi:hypothetical protein